MKKGLYRKLAINGIKNNRKFYLPYIIAATGTIMMAFILNYLGVSPALSHVKGGRTLGMILSLGRVVIAIFGVIFLFYTNSFIIKRRNREFGLYNVLGMNRSNVMKVVGLETLITAIISLVAGMGLGTLFSKLAEMILIRMLGGKAEFEFSIVPEPYIFTTLVFGGIFVLLLFVEMGRIKLSNPMQLLGSQTVGEKPPRANFVVAILGLAVLGGAYYMAITISDPLSAVTLFFIAVIMVIVATYMLFIAGSVAVCKILKKKKNYYYKPEHFISVSSMAYRMKRNGAGLASICILCTMVLVMIASSGSLYAGINDLVDNTNRTDIMIGVDVKGAEAADEEVYSKLYDIAMKATEGSVKNPLTYAISDFYANIENDELTFQRDKGIINESTFYRVQVLGESDYRKIIEDYKYTPLADDEIILCSGNSHLKLDSLALKLDDGSTIKEFKVRETIKKTPVTNGNEYMVNNIVIVAKEIGTFTDCLRAYDKDVEFLDEYCFLLCDTDCVQNDQYEIENRISPELSKLGQELHKGLGYGYRVSLRDDLEIEYRGLYGGLFFIGIALSIVFICATVMIIYYKQISEGYEDKSRFEIMQKIGMTDDEIRRSVNSQVVTVFFAPIVMAGIHLAFAFNMIKVMLTVFGMFNAVPFAITCVGCFVAFAIFYALVYKKTSKSYLEIVS